MRLNEIERLILPACRKFEVKRLDRRDLSTLLPGRHKGYSELDSISGLSLPLYITNYN